MRTAVVTGGGSGIGLAVAERLRKDGYRVATVDLKPSETQLAFTADVTDRAQIDAERLDESMNWPANRRTALRISTSSKASRARSAGA